MKADVRLTFSLLCRTQVQGMVHLQWVDLLASVNLVIKLIPYRHAQRPIFHVTLDLIKLTTEIHHHSFLLRPHGQALV